MKHHKTTLPNGLRVIHIPLKDNPATTVLVMSEAGSKYETPTQSGLSHFLEHMLFKGTEKRPGASVISTELDGLGAEYNAFTGHEFTGYYAKAPVKHFAAILDVISDFYINPTFPVEEIEKEKGVVIEEINMYEDLPQRKVMDIFSELLYGTQPAGRNITGSRETVASFTQKDLFRYKGDHYVASGTVVVVAGDLKASEVHRSVEKAFSGLSEDKKRGKKKVVEKQKGPQISHFQKKVDQDHLVLGVRSYPADHPDVPVLRVIDDILGGGMSSRLFQKLRDKMGVAYYAGSFQGLFTDHGCFGVRAGVTHARLKEVIEVICKELKRLKDEPVSKAELKKVKEYGVGSLFLGLETSDSVAEFYSEQELLQGQMISPQALAKKIRSVTAEDIRRVAQDIFTDRTLNLAVVNKSKDISSLKDVLSVE